MAQTTDETPTTPTETTPAESGGGEVTPDFAPLTTQYLTPADQLPVVVRRTLAEKLALIAGEVQRLKNTAYNEHHKFNYSPVGDVKDQIRPLLAKMGIIIIPAITATRYQDERTYLDMLFTITDGHEKIEIPWTSQAKDKGDFGTTKALSFGIKYLLMTMFLMSSADEMDGDSGAGIEALIDPINKAILMIWRGMANDDMREDEELLTSLYNSVAKPKKGNAPKTPDNAAKVLIGLHRKSRTLVPIKATAPLTPTEQPNDQN